MKTEIRNYVGHETQLYGVEEHRLVGGKGDGQRLYEVHNGCGLDLTVSPDRNCDIPRLRCKGINKLAEEVGSSAGQQIQQLLLLVRGDKIRCGVQRQRSVFGQMQGNPAVVPGQGSGPGPENLAGSGKFVQHGGDVIPDP